MKHLKTKPITDLFTNCTLKSETNNELYYDFAGDSMLNNSRDRILDGEILKCEKENLINSLIKGFYPIKSSDAFAVKLIGGGVITAQIRNVNTDSETIQLAFLNSNKEQFPDISIRTDDIKSVFKVTETIRLMNSMNMFNSTL